MLQASILNTKQSKVSKPKPLSSMKVGARRKPATPVSETQLPKAEVPVQELANQDSSQAVASTAMHIASSKIDI